jgi:elongation factor Ts
MAVTAALVKELRNITSAGMSDCKNALVESDGDIQKAVDILREKGITAAANKAGRVATEGLVHSIVTDDNKIAVIVEVNSETDFVAKNEEFVNYVSDVSNQVVKSDNSDMQLFLEEKWNADNSLTVTEALNQKVAIIGEKLTIRRFDKFINDGECVLVSYIHGAGKVAVIVSIKTTSSYDDIKEMGKNLCMQIAAMNPKFKTTNEVSTEYIDKEREILTNQAEGEDKPKEIIAKMIEGRLNKQLKEVCLLEQEYVKDGDLTVSQYIEAVSKKLGSNISVNSFTRFEIGEGLEKKEENFADEVNKVMNG